MAMNIAMFSWESLHSVAIGGLAPHASELAAGLARRGHEIHIFTRVGIGQSPYDFIDGVHYHRCPFETHPDFMTMIDRMNDSFVWHFGETEQFLGRPFDIVHGHDWLSVRSIAQVKNTHHRPAVLTIHSTEYGRCGNSVWEDPLSRRIRDIEWEGGYLADRVICVSQTLGREVQDLYSVPSDKCFSIYNGVHPWKFDGEVDVSRVRKQVGIGLDEPCVLFAGRMTWQKGPDLLLEAVPGVLEQHPRTKILFAGDGDMREGLEQRAVDIGISPSTRFLGHRIGNELIGLFKSTDVVCVPSRNEPFGIVILEAWSARKPVVATRIGGPEEFVKDDYNGLKVGLKPEEIGLGLNTLLGDRAGSKAMGLNGRRDAESSFSWDISALETEKVYASALGNSVNGNGSVRHRLTKETVHMSLDKTKKIEAHETREVVGIVKSKPANTVLAQHEPTEVEIRKRAYEIYLARGQTKGDSVADWVQAERELRERPRATSSKK
ncbi:MAG: glycosyltransferase [Planctomycetota bacterium]